MTTSFDYSSRPPDEERASTSEQAAAFYDNATHEEHLVTVTPIVGPVDEMSMDDVKMTSSREVSMEYTKSVSLFGSQTMHPMGYFQRLRQLWWYEIVGLIFLVTCLGFMTFGLGVSTNNFWAIAAPVSMVLILFLTALVRDYKEGSLRCSEVCYYIQYKMCGRPLKV